MQETESNYEQQFAEWLNAKKANGSGMPSSYLKAIENLNNLFNENLLAQTNIIKLEELYQDLLKHQADPQSKYYKAGAMSYARDGYYSAAIGNYIKFLKQENEIKNPKTRPKNSIQIVENKLAQAICVIGDSGVGKSTRVQATLTNDGHKTELIILDNMWQHMLVDYAPEHQEYRLTRFSEFIKKASLDQGNCYTIIIDECHKNLEIINDSLLQAISTKRNNGIRFLALNSIIDNMFSFLPGDNGIRVLPINLGFIFISSKADIILGNDDLSNRIEIVELLEIDKINIDYSIDFLLSKIKLEQLSEYTN